MPNRWVLIYPTKSEPIVFGAGPPPAPDTTYPPWSEPVRDLRGNIGRFIQTGSVFPWGAPRVETSEDRWHQPWSQHPGFKPGVLTAAQRADFFGRAAPFPQTVYIPSLWPRFNEPVRENKDRYLSTVNQRAFFFTQIQFKEVTYIPAFWPRFNEPVRENKDRYLSAVNQKAFFFTQIQFSEIIYISSLWPRFEEPVRKLEDKYLHASRQPFFYSTLTNIFPDNPNRPLYRPNRPGNINTRWGGRNG